MSTFCRRRLWVVSDMYYPEDVSTGYYMTRIAEGLASAREVHVVCGQPSYARHGVRAAAVESRNGTCIRRVAATHFAKDRMALRALNVITFTMSALLLLLLNSRRGDQILCVTNPPSLPPLLSAVAKWRGVDFYLLVHDVFPETLAATRPLTFGRLAYRLLVRFANGAYRRATAVAVLGRDMAELAARKRGSERGIVIIENWADLDEIHPLADADNGLLAEIGLRDARVLQFSGNIGRTHDVEGIIALARAFRRPNGDHNWSLLVAGFGGKQELVEQAAGEAATNIIMLPRQPRERLNELINCADIFVIAFVPGMFGLSVPSRMYNVMAAGRPILAICDSGSELARVVAEEDCGWHFDRLNPELLVEFIESLDDFTVARKGANSRKAAVARYSEISKIKAWEALLNGRSIGVD
jgi:colanic acid biosynthesis glycosyl transferase WcaI